MRRIVSILLVLLFWAGPLSALMPASAENPLPACCRRHGVHHCMMHMGDAVDAVARHAFAAPARCPLYRRGIPANTPVFTLAAVPAIALAQRAAEPLPVVEGAVLHRARAGWTRGPPARL